MNDHETSVWSDRATSRRLFLRDGAGIVVGSGLAAALPATVAGASRQFRWPIVLRASRHLAAPDGREREVWSYSKEVPGLLLRAREGERVRIRVINDLPVPTSIHWHGIHQHGTASMDGVDKVSREPIPPGEEFLYEFKAEPAGTHWYHSHVGVQYGNGLFGPLIVEEKTPIAAYDREEVILLNDWFRELGDALLAGLLKGPGMEAMPGTARRDLPPMKQSLPRSDMPPMKATTPRTDMPAMKKMGGMDGIPGMAMERKDIGDLPFNSGLVNGKGRAAGTMAPLATFEVGEGETLRLRLINGSSTFAFRFQVDGHPLTVIATDGSPMKPVVVDNLTLAAGERYDVLLKAERRGVHWIRAATLDGDEVRAILRYRGEARSEPDPTPVRWGPRALKPEMMRSPGPVALDAKPREIPIVLGGTMKPYQWSIGGQVYPRADPIAIREGESIRFVFRNTTGMDHPFHIHGHSFAILGRPGALNTKDPVIKDTVNVPARSDLVVQWAADNPGRWFLHCHIEWHMATGMARVLEVAPR